MAGEKEISLRIWINPISLAARDLTIADIENALLKENIELADLDRCYEIVKSVPLKRYTWKDNVYTLEQVTDRSKLGWIAQDVQAAFPKAVNSLLLSSPNS